MKAKTTSSKRSLKAKIKTAAIKRPRIPIDPHLKAAESKIGPSARMKKLAQSCTNYAIQQLEHGWMLEPFTDKDIKTVYTLFDSQKKTKVCKENWKKGDKPDSRPDLPERFGNSTKPQRGFSQVWGGKSPDGGLTEEERISIGYGQYAEFGLTPTTYYQEFDKGILLGGEGFMVNYQVSGNASTIVFILYKNGTWDKAEQ